MYVLGQRVIVTRQMGTEIWQERGVVESVGCYTIAPIGVELESGHVVFPLLSNVRAVYSTVEVSV